MEIKIGNNNKIKNSVIGNNNNPPPPEQNFASRHPITTGILVSLFTGFIMLFSFWKDIIAWIERLFKQILH